MDGRWSDAERGRGLPDVQQRAVGGISFWLEAGDLPVLPQVANMVALEAVPMRRPAALPIEDSGDHGVRVVRCKAADECDRVFVGANSGLALALERQVDLGQSISLPAQRDMSRRLFALDLNDDLID